MTDLVYASAGGERYHRTSSCPALEMGQNIHDYDCDCWGYCTHSRAWRIEETAPSQALADGKTPCRRCLPDAIALDPSENDFGHEPVPVYTNGKLRTVECSRCATTVTHHDEAYQPSRWTKPVAWPCTTAVVLGLAPRSAA